MNKTFVTSLIDKRDIAENTLQFVLQRPDGFDFKAGQNVNVKLSQLLFADRKGGRRTFSIASAPSEENLYMATRKTGSGFKRTIAEALGQTIEITGPAGRMIRDETRPAVLLAGGIGITPFRSMIMDAVNRQLQQPITLMFSNNALAEIAYHDLFLDLERQHPDAFRYVQTITGEKSHDVGWSGERRRIDAFFIRDYVPDLSAVTFYVSGPPAMVAAISEILKKENVDQDHILSESFWGY
ncbi:FAD-dependent oxidoreductase [candidate division KSB1 bacterium]|nr:FAD-dependent oxidoreductase [candidate division KSB1 bacterium]RQW05281.1 MAG: FAD-dependent oxidoreductase [candidate division KSB1 bacterium]